MLLKAVGQLLQDGNFGALWSSDTIYGLCEQQRQRNTEARSPTTTTTTPLLFPSSPVQCDTEMVMDPADISVPIDAVYAASFTLPDSMQSGEHSFGCDLRSPSAEAGPDITEIQVNRPSPVAMQVVVPTVKRVRAIDAAAKEAAKGVDVSTSFVFL